MHASIRQTKESGIYEHWVKAYSKERLLPPKPSAEYEQGEAINFAGLFIISVAGLAAATLIFFIESTVLVKRKRQSSTTVATETVNGEPSEMMASVVSVLSEAKVAGSSYYRRRMSILDVVWAGQLAEPSDSTVMAKTRPICDTPQASMELSSTPLKTAIRPHVSSRRICNGTRPKSVA